MKASGDIYCFVLLDDLTSSSLAQQPLSVKACLPLEVVIFSDLLITPSRIVSSTYGGTVHSRHEPMTGRLLSCDDLTPCADMSQFFSEHLQSPCRTEKRTKGSCQTGRYS